jgi:adenosylmethionine-8-amino-7-oxononanoate aminotransferase
MSIAKTAELSLRGSEGIWGKVFSYHPFTPVLERAEGIYLYDSDGNRYIDASGGPLAINLGHGDRRVIEAMMKQAERFAYCHPTLSNQPRAALCERISQVTPGNLNTSYLVSGGSEAVETAIKLARQYHVERGNPHKHMVISRWESYHGMTLGALSVSGNPKNRDKFTPMVLQWPHIPQPSTYRYPSNMSFEEHALFCAQQLEEAIHYVGAQHVSAFLATPVGAGEDYGLVPPIQYWQTIRDICNRYDILLIADEVVTGFGRTGKWFAMEHFAVQPDILITAKGISSLYAPLGAVTVSDEVNEPFREGGASFVHGFTNQGHPLACAAGLAVIDILEQDGLVGNSAQVGSYLHAQKHRLLQHSSVADVRGTGLLLVAELVKNKKTRGFFPPEIQAEQRLQAIALKHGLALYATLYGPRRPESHHRGLPIFISPPLCITREQVDELLDALDATLTEWEQQLGVPANG